MIELPLLKRYIEREIKAPRDDLEKFLCYFDRIGGDELLIELAKENVVIGDMLGQEKKFFRDMWEYTYYLQ